MGDFADLERAFERGLSAWQGQIMVQQAQRMGLKAVGQIKRLTPVDTGRLRRAWKAKVQKDGEAYIIMITNNTVYGPAINYGGRIVRNGRTVGRRRGIHMLENGIYQYKRTELSADIRTMLEELRRSL